MYFLTRHFLGHLTRHRCSNISAPSFIMLNVFCVCGNRIAEMVSQIIWAFFPLYHIYTSMVRGKMYSS